MTGPERVRFDEFLSEASILLAGIPCRPPLDPQRVEDWQRRVARARRLSQLLARPYPAPPAPLMLDEWRRRISRARRLSQRPKEWRPALEKLAEQVRTVPESEWRISRATEFESDPAMMAVWIAGGRPALIVQDGQLPPQKEVAEALRGLASGIQGRAGRRHVGDTNLDAAILMLLRAYGGASGRAGRAALAVTLHNLPSGGQGDAGRSAAFVRAAIGRLAPDIAEALGPQAVNAAARRCRAILYGSD